MSGGWGWRLEVGGDNKFEMRLMKLTFSALFEIWTYEISFSYSIGTGFGQTISMFEMWTYETCFSYSIETGFDLTISMHLLLACLACYRIMNLIYYELTDPPHELSILGKVFFRR